MVLERGLPSVPEFEKAVLGSLLLDSDAFSLVDDLLTAEDFYSDAHRIIYTAIQRVARRGNPTDQMLVEDELALSGHLDAIGGYGTIGLLITLDASSANVVHYAKKVAHAALMRRVIHAAGEIAARAYASEEDALDYGEQLLFSLRRHQQATSFLPLGEITEEYMEELDFLHEHRGQVFGIPTGFTDLDTVTGGLQRGDLIILGARPSLGKSALAMNIGFHAAHTYKKKVAVVSLEMSRKSLACRMLASRAGVEMHHLRTGWVEDDEWDRILPASNAMRDLPMWINDASQVSTAILRSRLRKLATEQHGLDLIIVDYLQMVEPDETEGKRKTREQEVADISRNLKAIAKELNCPVLALAQLSRAVESRSLKVPQLSDLRDSGGIEQDADLILFLYRDDFYALLEHRESERPNIADVIIAKHRNGPTGTVSLYFEGKYTRFANLDVAVEPLEEQ